MLNCKTSVYFKVLLQQLPWGPRENHENISHENRSPRGFPNSGPLEFERGVFDSAVTCGHPSIKCAGRPTTSSKIKVWTFLMEQVRAAVMSYTCIGRYPVRMSLILT